MSRARLNHLFALVAFLLFAAVGALLSGCGGGSGSSPSNSGGNGATPTANTVTITVNAGPAAAVGVPATDSAFASVTVCVPGSTSQCQTIDGILVDTGSAGLRVLSSALTLSLPQQKDSSNHPIVECAQFADNETWGPVQTADISLAGEKASSVPIQVIGSSSFSTVPGSCSSHGPVQVDLPHVGANGILGVGNFVADCGPGCVVSGAGNAGFYYSCPTATTCQITGLALASQVSNPVASFASDNNGVIIELPAVSSPATTITGSMIFGIGTQSDNALSNVTVYTVDPDLGNFSTSLNGQTYNDASFLDTGSNAIYFLDSATLNMSTCTDFAFLYCPGSARNFSPTNIGFNGTSASTDFSIENADTLSVNGNDNVLPDLGGPNPGEFDYGLPFFFGRNVFTAIEGRNTPSGTGPYVAF